MKQKEKMKERNNSIRENSIGKISEKNLKMCLGTATIKRCIIVSEVIDITYR